MAIEFARIDNSIVYDEGVTVLTIPSVTVGIGEDLQVAIRHRVDEDATSVVFNGSENLVQIGDREVAGSTMQQRWGIKNPTPTTGNIVITFPSPQTPIWAISFGYTGIDQTTYFDNTSGNGELVNNSPELDIDGSENALVIASYVDNGSFGTPTFTPDAGTVTDAQKTALNGENFILMSKVSSAGLVNIGGTNNMNNTWVMVAGNFVESGGGGPTLSFKTLNSISAGDLKTIGGIEVASIKTWNGF